MAGSIESELESLEPSCPQSRESHYPCGLQNATVAHKLVGAQQRYRRTHEAWTIGHPMRISAV